MQAIGMLNIFSVHCVLALMFAPLMRAIEEMFLQNIQLAFSIDEYFLPVNPNSTFYEEYFLRLGGIKMSIVENIRKLSSAKDMSITSLERELGFGKGTITKWDVSSPSTDKLQKVADYFRVSIDQLVGREKSSDLSELSGVYLSFAKDAQDNGIDPEDIKQAIELIKKYQKR